ncbi:50S ribosomal protein L13 [Buchnera aphidicola (Tetraneura ulmi)]|uniref:50S ribosomal protein L13 n=1 Tax=Buchnera aphidicola TaxID=9 RepID=UPI0034649401
MKTYSAKITDIKRSWYTVDACGKILGRLATNLSIILRGKHKVEYTPHVDTGDFLIVLNASKVVVSGKKNVKKLYFHYTGYAGGLKKITFKEMLIKNPEKIIKIAVKGMLPKGPLGRKMLSKLKIFSGSKHDHDAQQPKILNF